jgi:hypothetical protein
MRSSLDRIEIDRQRIQRSLQATEVVVARIVSVTHCKTHTKRKPPEGGFYIRQLR